MPRHNIQHYPHSLAGAMQAYTRLCQDPSSGAVNAFSALPLVRDGLAYAHLTREVLDAVARAKTPQRAVKLAPRFRVSLQDMSMHLNVLWKYELLIREAIRDEGLAYEYRLSPFGRMVLGLQQPRRRRREAWYVADGIA